MLDEESIDQLEDPTDILLWHTRQLVHERESPLSVVLSTREDETAGDERVLGLAPECLICMHFLEQRARRPRHVRRQSSGGGICINLVERILMARLLRRRVHSPLSTQESVGVTLDIGARDLGYERDVIMKRIWSSTDTGRIVVFTIVVVEFSPFGPGVDDMGLENETARSAHGVASGHFFGKVWRVFLALGTDHMGIVIFAPALLLRVHLLRLDHLAGRELVLDIGHDGNGEEKRYKRGVEFDMQVVVVEGSLGQAERADERRIRCGWERLQGMKQPRWHRKNNVPDKLGIRAAMKETESGRPKRRRRRRRRGEDGT